jgi:hypothetical protein
MNYADADNTHPQLFCKYTDPSTNLISGVQHSGKGIFFYYDISNNAPPVSYTTEGIYIPSVVPSIPYYNLDLSDNIVSTTTIGNGVFATNNAGNNTFYRFDGLHIENTNDGRNCYLIDCLHIENTNDGTNSYLYSNVLELDDPSSQNYTKIFSSGSATFHNVVPIGDVYDIVIGASAGNIPTIRMTNNIGNPFITTDWFLADSATNTVTLSGDDGNNIQITNDYISNYNIANDTYSYMGYSGIGNITGLQVQQGYGGINYTGMDYNGVYCVDNNNGIYSSSFTQTQLQIIDASNNNTSTLTTESLSIFTNGVLTAKINNPLSLNFTFVTGELTVDCNQLTLAVGTYSMTDNITSFNYTNFIVGSFINIFLVNDTAGDLNISAVSSGANTYFDFTDTTTVVAGSRVQLFSVYDGTNNYITVIGFTDLT